VGIVRAEVRFDLAYGQDMDAITDRVPVWIRQTRASGVAAPGGDGGCCRRDGRQKIARATVEWQNVNGFQFDLKERVAAIVAEDRARHAVTPTAAPPVR
jgi:hypothetical protein